MDFYQAMWIWKAAVLPGESFTIEKEIPLSLGHCPMHKQYPHWTTHVHTSHCQQSSVMITHYWRTEAPPRLRLKQLGGKSLKLPKEIYPKGSPHSLTHSLLCIFTWWHGINDGMDRFLSCSNGVLQALTCSLRPIDFPFCAFDT